MKKLICENDMKAIAEKGQKLLCVDFGTIITPSAKDLANELGIEISIGPAPMAKNTCKNSGLVKPGKGIDRDVIYQMVKAALTNRILTGSSVPVLERPFLTEREPKSGLRIVRGKTVKLENFDTGNPRAKVAYRELVSKDESQMSAGFLTIDNSSFDWELCYEEIDIILEGSLSITINGVTYEACQGDILFVPKGSKVTWSSSGYVKLFYTTYPANWSDLMDQQ
ncbi:cupin domain-containing protein [Desulfitobacterium sp. THU1]|uniref:cupin domain-containing protein n=1 Tax=Desulfitobacterium sp. THU1 TaxID=3138072 RepID=UPI00311FB68E